MRHTQHPSNNMIFGVPEGWDQAKLPMNPLAATRAESNGIPSIASFWKPSADELARINAGEPIVLWVIGATMPPVSIEVGF